MGSRAGRIASVLSSEFSNAIINGSFSIWQRGASFSADGYTADRWGVLFGGATGTVTRTNITGISDADIPGSPTSALKATKASGGSNPRIRHRIEDVRTFAGSPVTLTLGIHAETTASTEIRITQNFGSGGSSAAVQTFPVDLVGGEWNKVQIGAMLPSLAGKVIGTGVNSLDIDIAMPSGAVTWTLAQASLLVGAT